MSNYFTAAMLGQAIAIAAECHKNQLDKQGMPYILHPITVMLSNMQETPDYELLALAVCHDVIEDSADPLILEKLSEFPQTFRFSLSLLTHPRSVSYEDYISRIGYGTVTGDVIGGFLSDSQKLEATVRAIKVKIADLRHNSDITRLKGVTDKDLERIAKYHRSYLFLKEMKRHYEIYGLMAPDWKPEEI